MIYQKMPKTQSVFAKSTRVENICSNFVSNSRSHKKAAMQEQENILNGQNIQSRWCLECDSYMHTSGIVLPRHSHRKTFHIAHRGR